MSRKDPKPYERDGIGILNPYGDLWTNEVFSTEALAKAHLEAFWRGVKDAPELRKYRFVPVRQTTVVRTPETVAA